MTEMQNNEDLRELIEWVEKNPELLERLRKIPDEAWAKMWKDALDTIFEKLREQSE